MPKEPILGKKVPVGNGGDGILRVLGRVFANKEGSWRAGPEGKIVALPPGVNTAGSVVENWFGHLTGAICRMDLVAGNFRKALGFADPAPVVLVAAIGPDCPRAITSGRAGPDKATGFPAPARRTATHGRGGALCYPSRGGRYVIGCPASRYAFSGSAHLHTGYAP